MKAKEVGIALAVLVTLTSPLFVEVLIEVLERATRYHYQAVLVGIGYVLCWYLFDQARKTVKKRGKMTTRKETKRAKSDVTA